MDNDPSGPIGVTILRYVWCARDIYIVALCFCQTAVATYHYRMLYRIGKPDDKICVVVVLNVDTCVPILLRSLANRWFNLGSRLGRCVPIGVMPR